MKKRLLYLLAFLMIFALSALVVLLPSFFPQGLSRVELHQEIALERVLNGTRDVELVFFGYSGCVDVCTPRLESLGKWYPTLPAEMRKRIGIRFIDLSVPEATDLPHIFATAFHPEFKGVYLKKEALKRYTETFNVYFSSSLFRSGEYDHSTHLYAVKRYADTDRLRFIYPLYPYDFVQIEQDLRQLLDESRETLSD